MTWLCGSLPGPKRPVSTCAPPRARAQRSGGQRARIIDFPNRLNERWGGLQAQDGEAQRGTRCALRSNWTGPTPGSSAPLLAAETQLRSGADPGQVLGALPRLFAAVATLYGVINRKRSPSTPCCAPGDGAGLPAQLVSFLCRHQRHDRVKRAGSSDKVEALARWRDSPVRRAGAGRAGLCRGHDWAGWRERRAGRPPQALVR